MKSRWKPKYVIPSAQADAWSVLLENPGLKRVLRRTRPSRGMMLYPNIMSDDPQTLKFMAQLADELTRALPYSVNEFGTVGSNAVAGDFYQLRTVAGYGMNPISIPPVSNHAIRAELGLTDGFVSDRHRKIATELMRSMFSNPLPAKVSIRREASTGSPDYVNDVIKKKTELRAALADLPRFFELVLKGNLRELFIQFNAPIIQTIGERTQADKVILKDGVFSSKDREVNDEEAARTGLKSGKRAPADKRVFVDGSEVKGHFAGRRRTVFGMSFVPNYVVAAFFSAWRAHYLDVYSFTWKHRTPDSILAKMKQYTYLAGFDVKQFDQTVPTFLIDFFCDELKNYAHPGLSALIRLMFSAPYIVPYPFIAGTSEVPFNPLFGDNPFDTSSFTMELGLPSGISCNPDFGKFAMVFQYLCICDDYFHDVIEVGLDTILRGEHDKYALLNMGDDCVLLTNDEPFHNYISKVEYKSNYFCVEEEKPISFLGNVPYTDDRGELQLAPNIASFFINWLVPEHGIDNHRRKNFWAVGDRERRQHYARSPSYSTAYGIYEELFTSAFGRSPGSIAAEYYDSQRKLGSLSFIDALVIQNPDYLQYRFDENEVSPEILELLITSLGADEVWPHINPFL